MEQCWALTPGRWVLGCSGGPWKPEKAEVSVRNPCSPKSQQSQPLSYSVGRTLRTLRRSHSRLPVQLPVEFLLLLTVPVVDPDKDDRNWKRPLNCLHLVISPVVVVLTLQSGACEYPWGTDTVWGTQQATGHATHTCHPAVGRPEQEHRSKFQASLGDQVQKIKPKQKYGTVSWFSWAWATFWSPFRVPQCGNHHGALVICA